MQQENAFLESPEIKNFKLNLKVQTEELFEVMHVTNFDCQIYFVIKNITTLV